MYKLDDEDVDCSRPALKIGKIPVYSANPWIESFAHTVHDAISQQRSFYYTNDPKYKVFYYKLHSSRLAQRIYSGKLVFMESIP